MKSFGAQVAHHSGTFGDILRAGSILSMPFRPFRVFIFLFSGLGEALGQWRTHCGMLACPAHIVQEEGIAQSSLRRLQWLPVP